MRHLVEKPVPGMGTLKSLTTHYIDTTPYSMLLDSESTIWSNPLLTALMAVATKPALHDLAPQMPGSIWEKIASTIQAIASWSPRSHIGYSDMLLMSGGERTLELDRSAEPFSLLRRVAGSCMGSSSKAIIDIESMHEYQPDEFWQQGTAFDVLISA